MVRGRGDPSSARQLCAKQELHALPCPRPGCYGRPLETLCTEPRVVRPSTPRTRPSPAGPIRQEFLEQCVQSQVQQICGAPEGRRQVFVTKFLETRESASGPGLLNIVQLLRPSLSSSVVCARSVACVEMPVMRHGVVSSFCMPCVVLPAVSNLQAELPEQDLQAMLDMLVAEGLENLPQPWRVQKAFRCAAWPRPLTTWSAGDAALACCALRSTHTPSSFG